MGRGAETREGQRRGGPFVEDGRLVGEAECERAQTLQVAEQDFPLLGVQEQGTGLVVGPQLGALAKQRREVALQQAVVQGQPQPGPAAAHVRAHEADLLQLLDHVTGGEGGVTKRDITRYSWVTLGSH